MSSNLEKAVRLLEVNTPSPNTEAVCAQSTADCDMKGMIWCLRLEISLFTI